MENIEDHNMMVVDPVMKPVIPTTLKKIKPGYSSRFRTRDFSSLGSVRAAICKMNAKGYQFNIVDIFNNGESYVVQRIK